MLNLTLAFSLAALIIALLALLGVLITLAQGPQLALPGGGTFQPGDMLPSLRWERHRALLQTQNYLNLLGGFTA